MDSLIGLHRQTESENQLADHWTLRATYTHTQSNTQCVHSISGINNRCLHVADHDLHCGPPDGLQTQAWLFRLIKHTLPISACNSHSRCIARNCLSANPQSRCLILSHSLSTSSGFTTITHQRVLLDNSSSGQNLMKKQLAHSVDINN